MFETCRRKLSRAKEGIRWIISPRNIGMEIPCKRLIELVKPPLMERLPRRKASTIYRSLNP